LNSKTADSEAALDKVKEGVDRAQPTCRRRHRPTVTEINTSLFPILTVILSGLGPTQRSTRLSKTFSDRSKGCKACLKSMLAGPATESCW